VSIAKKVITALVGLALLGLMLVVLMPAPVDVSTTRVRQDHFVEYVEDEGRTRLRDVYMVSTPIGGWLRRVDLEPGDPVEAGQRVFVLEPTPTPALDPRTREQARETLSAMEARLEAAQAEHEQRQSEARFAEDEYRRHQQLFERGVVSAAELDRARIERDRGRAAEQAARAAMNAARYEVQNARAVLEIAEGTRSLEESRTLEVRAPLGGVVLRRHRCCEGVVQAGAPILEIGNLADLEVQVDLLSMDAVRLRRDMRVVLERWGGSEPLEGRVRLVEPAGFKRVSALGVDEQRVPVLVEITAPREDWDSLGEGYRVEARFVLWEGEDVVQVPISALFRKDDAWNVFVVDNGRARERPVEVGRRSGLWTQILAGLEPDEVVITHPGDRVVDGVRVATDR
jgi:HlyD family secretion protein